MKKIWYQGLALLFFFASIGTSLMIFFSLYKQNWFTAFAFLVLGVFTISLCFYFYGGILMMKYDIKEEKKDEKKN